MRCRDLGFRGFCSDSAIFQLQSHLAFLRPRMAEPFCMAHVAAKTVLTYSEMSLSLNTEVPKMPEAAGPRNPQTPESPLLGGSWELVRKDIRTFTRIISRVTLFIARVAKSHDPSSTLSRYLSCGRRRRFLCSQVSFSRVRPIACNGWASWTNANKKQMHPHYKGLKTSMTKPFGLRAQSWDLTVYSRRARFRP